ncbi:MAG: hypothetical protein ACRDPY_45255, partial [Streptosporangiaceae bacterium]
GGRLEPHRPGAAVETRAVHRRMVSNDRPHPAAAPRRRHLRQSTRPGSRDISTAGTGIRDLRTSPASAPARTLASRTSVWSEVAVRIICWFPAGHEVVITLIGFDKKTIGEVFYASAAARGEALVDAWLRQKGSTDDRER